MQLGRLGVWTLYSSIGERNAGEAAKLAEDLGYGAIWIGNSPKLPTLRPLLDATDRIVAASGIANVWQYDAAALAADHATLTHDFPGRVLSGIGIGHVEVTSHYARPLATMRAYLDVLDAAEPPLPRDERCIAALGPKMLTLSAERSLGTHPYFTPVEHTRFARERLGASALIATELACVVDTDSVRARASARQYAKHYLGRESYTSNLLKFGYTEEDIAGAGSDRLIDDLVPQGTAEQVAAVVRRHLEAGADQVCLQTVGVAGVPRAEWTGLAAALSDVLD